MRRLVLLCVLLACSVRGATVYVRTDGHDTASGANNTSDASTGAKLTISGAISAINPGDTIAINDGTYTGVYAVSTAKNGTAGSPTVIKAINPLMVTNQGGFTISQGGSGYLEWHDLILQDSASVSDWSGILQFWHSSSGGAIGPGFVVSNCWFVGTQSPTSRNIIGLNMDMATNAAACAANFKLLSCVFTNTSQYCASLMMSNGLVANCRFDFANTHDAIHLWGMNNWISNNVFTNISANPSVSDHTDILQYWNDSTTPSVCSNVYFCDNLIVNCDAQMFELQQDGNCSWFFLTNACPLGGLYVFNNVYQNVDRPGYISIPDAHFYNNLWYKCRQASVGGGSTVLIFGGLSNSCGQAYGCTISNCAFVDCGNSNYVNDSQNGWFNDGNTGGLTNFNADYNFVCGDTTNYPAKNSTMWTASGVMNAHSVNGGNPYFRAQTISDFHLNKNSPLIDAGAVTALFGADKDGSTRPQGSGWEIGPFEFDPTLQLLLSPALDFSGGTMSDLTGYGHDGLRFSATNWPYATNVQGRSAAFFTVTPGNIISPPEDSGWGQYIAITNLTSIGLMTNGTVSLWARYYPTKAGGTNWDEATTQRLFDAGFQGSTWSAGTFFIGRGYDPVSGDNYHTVMRAYNTNGLLNPTTLFAFPDGSAAGGGDTTNWNFYSITWDGTNVFGYFNGTNIATVAMTNAPYLRLTNDYHWIGLGCWTHNGTPQWGDDSYPNNGWMNGGMGETRVYSRALSPTEMASLYAGSGAALASSGVGGSGGGGSVTRTARGNTAHIGTLRAP